MTGDDVDDDADEVVVVAVGELVVVAEVMSPLET